MKCTPKNTMSYCRAQVLILNQGSILGPLLFILNVNDFSRSSDLLFSILFADDTSVFIEGHSYAEVIEILNNELLKVSDWLMANKLTINLEKVTI